MKCPTVGTVSGVVLLALVALGLVPASSAQTPRVPGGRNKDPGGRKGPACTEAIAAIVGAAGSGGKAISGTIRFLKANGGTRVTITVNGLQPGTSHPFHVHENGVGKNDCDKAGGHFNPGKVSFECPGRVFDQTKCQVGDLSGKFEPLKPRGGGAASVSYVDKSIDIPAIINRGVVVHDGTSKKLKIACGTIVCKK